VLYAKAKWTMPELDDQAVERLASKLNISKMVARLLVIRGITNTDEAEQFLYAKEDQLHDPFLLDGMKAAVSRVLLALERKEKIRIYGDYDADGVSSTSLMIGLLRTLNAEFDYYIPHRQAEGYGLHIAAIDAAKQQGVDLIITVDTGISAVEEIAHAAYLGIDVIVTDHHEPPVVLPAAYAILNPRKPGCEYPFKSLAGVGVAFKLAHALLGRMPNEWLEYVAIGTIADLMPLQDENRILVKLGIERIRSTRRAGIHALLRVSGIDKQTVSAGHIGFSIAPRINASGRLDRADTAVSCLTSENEQEADQLAHDLDRLNRERQQIVEDIASEALEQARQMEQYGTLGKVLVLAGEGWNVGVVGIVASKVLERYYRPTIILSIDRAKGIAKGSARSIPGFDIHGALTECAEMLDHYGGHQAAAGMTLQSKQVNNLRKQLNDVAERVLQEGDLTPILTPDLELGLSDISTDVIDQLELLGPFGMNNPHPSFVMSGLRIKELKLLGKDRQHLKLMLFAPNAGSGARCEITPKTTELPIIEALAFGKAEWSQQMSMSGNIDVYGELSINEWNGVRRPQIMIKDLRITERQVFDWRGRSASDTVITEWLSRKQNAGTTSRGAIIFRVEEASLVQLADTSAALWLIKDDQLIALNGIAEEADPAQIKDLLFLTLPPAIERAANMLRLFSEVERVYAVFHDTRSYMSGGMPTREQFKQIYSLLNALREPISEAEALYRLRERTGLTSDSIRFILAVFADSGFIQEEAGMVAIVPSPPKKELADSSVYTEKIDRVEVEQVFIYSTGFELKEWIVHQLTPQAASRSLSASIS